ncbi:MAG: hypothetical protein E4H08_10545 [Candidatus Atribacteria bacterium]|nr:MAG: hypothetical protein E4H08_10545 [Candidatus Atribacteria bacterium]
MRIERKHVRRTALHHLLVVRKGLPEEKVLPLHEGAKAEGWLSYILPLAGLILLGFAIVGSSSWALRLPFVIVGTLLVLWAIVGVRRLRWNLKVRGGFAMVTPRFFVIVDHSGIRSQPVWDFSECSAKRASGGSLELRFRFGTKTLPVPFHLPNKDRAEKLVGWLGGHREASKRLLEQASIADRLKSGDWRAWGDLDPFPEISEKEKLGLAGKMEAASFWLGMKSRWVEITALVVSAVTLFFAVSACIDYNVYQEAHAVGTATAYREYLGDKRNVYYRGTAGYWLRALYDREIEAYNNRWGTSSGAAAFVTMLEYLRDHDIYSVPLTFEGRNLVKDVREEGFVVVSAVASFSIDKNRSRERSVAVEVGRTIGQYFPSDILRVDEGTARNGPHIAVDYTYRNESGSLYYPVDQSHLPESARTWYYGVQIDWTLSLYLLSGQPPIHQFTLTSEPAPQFTSYGESASAVYDAMAESAFDDFEDAFNEAFLSGS